MSGINPVPGQSRITREEIRFWRALSGASGLKSTAQLARIARLSRNTTKAFVRQYKRHGLIETLDQTWPALHRWVGPQDPVSDAYVQALQATARAYEQWQSQDSSAVATRPERDGLLGNRN
jgi:hypothetical protein